jgi:hypothetical protein
MTERPILFSGEMVKAILSGAKSQTRRVIKPQPHQRESGYWWFAKNCFASNTTLLGEVMEGFCPYGQPGDRLWVRETWGYSAKLPASSHSSSDSITWVTRPGWRGYKADNPDGNWCWKPSIHMPRWASRLTLRIRSVRVERVQDISEADAMAEGVNMEAVFEYEGQAGETARRRFRALWDSINGRRGFPWESNPFVWIIEFDRIP